MKPPREEGLGRAGEMGRRGWGLREARAWQGIVRHRRLPEHQTKPCLLEACQLAGGRLKQDRLRHYVQSATGVYRSKSGTRSCSQWADHHLPGPQDLVRKSASAQEFPVEGDWRWPGDSLCSRNARSRTPLVGRAHLGNPSGRLQDWKGNRLN